MKTHLRFADERGFSLIELMIGLAIGLLVTLTVSSTAALLNFQQKSTLAGNDARDSAQSAMTILERAVKLAGVGLYYNGQPLCASLNSFVGGKGAVTPLAPLRITAGAGPTDSDQITVAYGLANGGNTVASLVDTGATPEANFTVANSGAVAVGDLAIVGVPGANRPCTLFQVTDIEQQQTNCNNISTTCATLAHAVSAYNPAGTPSEWLDVPVYGHQPGGVAIGPAVVLRQGEFSHLNYAVLCGSLVSFRVGTTPVCAANNFNRLAGDIVQLKAQYGISDHAASNVVTSWVGASGTAWAAPTAADAARIKAIRVVIVSRQREPGAGSMSSTCTNAAGIPNTGPCSFQDAAAPVIDLSKTSQAGGLPWQRYRYRVYFSVIPLRSVLWNS